MFRWMASSKVRHSALELRLWSQAVWVQICRFLAGYLEHINSFVYKIGFVIASSYSWTTCRLVYRVRAQIMFVIFNKALSNCTAVIIGVPLELKGAPGKWEAKSGLYLLAFRSTLSNMVVPNQLWRLSTWSVASFSRDVL